MDHFIIWHVISYAWTEIGLEDTDYTAYAKKLRLHYNNWKDINKVIIMDVCASFAIISFLIIPSMLWMVIPDWEWDEENLERKMTKWYSRPYIVHFLNPFRILGYRVSLILSASVRHKLKGAFKQELRDT